MHHATRGGSNCLPFIAYGNCSRRFSTEKDGRSTRLVVPSLGQNSTMILRSQSKILSEIQIRPQWRDDTLLELVNINDCESYTDCITVEECAGDKQTFGGMQLTFHKDGVKTSLGRVGSLVEVDLLDPRKTQSNASDNSPKWKLVVSVPEKSNLTCQISHGDINVDGKLEGDSHLSTSNDSNITIGKLRGHNITLDNTRPNNENSKGVIYIKKAIEARTVHINASQRVRARMINGSNVDIQVNPSKSLSSKLDEDDEGAVIDIGSLYISHGSGDSEAMLNVDATNLDGSECGMVRVKSNHGHVTIHAKVNKNAASPKIPLIDLGGVNGSCDVLLESSQLSSVSNGKDMIVNRIHFDAFTPQSISTITCRGKIGDTSVTVDRKLDAELRLLSSVKSEANLLDTVDAHSLTSDDENDIQAAMQNLDNVVNQHSEQRSTNSISIETDAFENNDSPSPGLSSKVQYIEGIMKNCSGEPDSRFDLASKGKINKDGAAMQALNGFHSNADKDTNENSQDSVLPLLTVATDGKIKLETLSWLGSIARRYGLEENQKIALGRQASRKSSDRVNFLSKE